MDRGRPSGAATPLMSFPVGAKAPSLFSGGSERIEALIVEFLTSFNDAASHLFWLIVMLQSLFLTYVEMFGNNVDQTNFLKAKYERFLVPSFSKPSSSGQRFFMETGFPNEPNEQDSKRSTHAERSKRDYTQPLKN